MPWKETRNTGSLGFNNFNRSTDEKNEQYVTTLQQENINANTNNKLREPMRNLMFDPRVVRGKNAPGPQKTFDEAPPKKQKYGNYMGSKTKKKVVRVSDEPQPVKGRKHCDIQTDQYLEELPEDIPDYNAVTQTDPFLDRPATPLFIPWKSGPDKETQIYENDLFNFDMEVEPLLEVLVGRSIEQAVMEVMEDHQLAHIRMHQDRFEQLRIAEMVAAEKLEAAHIRALEEAARRREQERKRLEEEKRLRERMEAQQCAKWYLHEMKEKLIEKLQKEGYFYDPVQREIELQFIPSMLEGVYHHLEDIIRSRFALSYMVEEAIQFPDDEVMEYASEGVDMILDRIDDIIEAGDIFDDVVMTVRGTERASRQVIGDSMETVQVVHATAGSVIEGMTMVSATRAVAGSEDVVCVLGDLTLEAGINVIREQEHRSWEPPS
ncbi:radial spoke head protein 3 [Marchantia polymorpha subsp. ruderalis]|uniref:Radial spoke head protein 3 homolog n=2 Tax=Marchantia polymorpha TaxID=3197 RepID=A0AAF6BPL0_MARPO|nr:hypothetical protein MARPO_0053s0079 [Marchantia polymorpha]BBN13944.1 hypothetical protein Mp_6g07660 [Marchantia polymorpha subsp. ruderalis]|eukprot:PTQ38145.1 hypothetical protein MARPO_0053s0079 [Marchantia polymorpha]